MSSRMFSFLSPQSADRPYTISEINNGVSSIIEGGNTLLWVEGELSDFKTASSGHSYFRLNDAQSRIPAVIWKNVAEKISFEPEDGMLVTAIATLRVYTRGGYYQLDIHKMMPAGTGALSAAFEKLKKKLEAEGLFDQSRKRPLPESINRIGIITSKNGAAIRDIIKVVKSRSGSTDIVLIDVPVQGDMAAPAIVRAIADMNEYGRLDCIVVGRGGGSAEDLWAFNEESVARAIAASKIPVVSAVGHEIDFTIADFTADLRAPTPSAAAEMLTRDDDEAQRYFTSIAVQMTRLMVVKVEHAKDSYKRLVTRPVLRRPQRIISDARQRIDELDRQSTRALAVFLRRLRTRLDNAASRLNAISPLATMSRGYSVVTGKDGAVVKNASEIFKGEIINMKFSRGSASAEVLEIHP
jgi:exodeoxyribonuclease VII large subunit